MTTTGLLHFASGGIRFLALAVSCIVVGFAMRRRGESAVAGLSFASGVAVIVGFFGPMILPGPFGIAGIWFSVVVGWFWLALVSRRLQVTSPDPNCDPAPA